jgi:hypothetical protein
LIISFTEVDVIPLNAPASTTTKVATPRFTEGSMVTTLPEIVTIEDETPMVCKTVPPALPDLNVILPVPLDTCWSKVIMILESGATPAAPSAGLKVMGTGLTSSLVAVRVLPLIFLLLSITVVPETLIAIFILLFLNIYSAHKIQVLISHTPEGTNPGGIRLKISSLGGRARNKSAPSDARIELCTTPVALAKGGPTG